MPGRRSAPNSLALSLLLTLLLATACASGEAVPPITFVIRYSQ